MLRPATPLTILFFIAFVLLLLATISTPIVKGIPLATVGDKVQLGVFGYCTATGCSGIQVGYSVGKWAKRTIQPSAFPSGTPHLLTIDQMRKLFSVIQRERANSRYLWALDPLYLQF